MAGTNPNPSQIRCTMCGEPNFEDGEDGFFYCRNCGSRADDIMDTGVADEDFVDKGAHTGGGGALYLASHKRKATVLSQSPTLFSLASEDNVGPTEPTDFGQNVAGVAREEDYWRVIRRRYVVGVQTMLMMQCEALIEKFRVTPLICGIASSIWLRFLCFTEVLDDGWAERAVIESESQGDGIEGRKRYEGEPRNLYNKRMVLVWCRSLKKTIPLSSSIVVAYLACHVAREPVLPTDIVRWIMEGKLPYFSAFIETEKRMATLDKSISDIEISVQMPMRPIMSTTISIAKPSIACPLSASYMFRPFKAIPVNKLESTAAIVAESVSLSLPPVNFYAIASRYLKQLGLPLGKILPYARQIFEWSMPPQLWLSTNEARLPTRVCVMSILIVAIRILYNINGSGKWEQSLSVRDGSSSGDSHAEGSQQTSEPVAKDDVKEGSSSQGMDDELKEIFASVHKLESEATELLQSLDKRYNEINYRKEYSKDLPTYLQYCRDVVFAGPSEGDEKETELIEKLWDYYQKNREDTKSARNQERAKNDDDEMLDVPIEGVYYDDPETIDSSGIDAPQNASLSQIPASQGEVDTSNKHESRKDVAIRQLKIDMEEHRFFYISPRDKIKRHDNYLLYARKRDDGSLAYSAHADYYIILRACAKVVQVDFRIMHIAVLSLEKRIRWIEKKIDHSLQHLCLSGDDDDTPGFVEASESTNSTDQNL